MQSSAIKSMSNGNRKSNIMSKGNTKPKFQRKPKLSPEEARKALITGVTRFISILRELFRNNGKLAKNIDPAYAMVLEQQIKLIPKDWIVGSYETFNMLEGMINCFNFNKLNEVIQTSCSKIWFQIDSYSFVMNYMLSAFDLGPEAKAICENLMSIFKPLCDCIDHIFAYPEEFCQRLADLSETTDYDDIFGK